MDGRHARRQRSQQAVLNAIFELIEEGRLTPTVEEVGARAGVSVPTIFRNYGSLDELARQLQEAFRERFGELFLLPHPGEGRLDQRISELCDVRLRLFEAIWPFLQFMSRRAAAHPDAAENLGRIRGLLAAQIKRQFAPELRALSQAEASDRRAAIDALTSPESWALMQDEHGRSRRQVKRAWTHALTRWLA